MRTIVLLLAIAVVLAANNHLTMHPEAVKTVVPFSQVLLYGMGVVAGMIGAIEERNK